MASEVSFAALALCLYNYSNQFPNPNVDLFTFFMRKNVYVFYFTNLFINLVTFVDL